MVALVARDAADAGVVMMISEAHSGDLVAVELNGETLILRVGRVLGREGTKKRAFNARGVIVERLDPETLLPMPFDARCQFPMGMLQPDVELLEVVARIEWMRRLRYVSPIRARLAEAEIERDNNRECDPMHKMRELPDAPSLFDWVNGTRRGDEPF